ncbi:unnamed protein product [Closterium sp. NIES-54]
MRGGRDLTGCQRGLPGTGTGDATRPSGGRSSAGWSAGPRTAHQRGRRYGGRRCRDQYPHLADAQRTTHEAAEGTGSNDCAAAAGADHHRTHSSAQSHDQLHRCRRRLRRLRRLRYLRRLHCCHLHLHPRHHPTTTPTSSTASTSTSTTPTSPSTALAPLALAGAASPARGRRSADRLKTTEVGRSSRSNRGQEGGMGTPLKDGGARVTTRGSYSDYACLCC